MDDVGHRLPNDVGEDALGLLAHLDRLAADHGRDSRCAEKLARRQNLLVGAQPPRVANDGPHVGQGLMRQGGRLQQLAARALALIRHVQKARRKLRLQRDGRERLPEDVVQIRSDALAFGFLSQLLNLLVLDLEFLVEGDGASDGVERDRQNAQKGEGRDSFLQARLAEADEQSRLQRGESEQSREGQGPRPPRRRVGDDGRDEDEQLNVPAVGEEGRHGLQHDQGRNRAQKTRRESALRRWNAGIDQPHSKIDDVEGHYQR